MSVLVPDREVPLAPLTTLGVGGAADCFMAARTAADIILASQWCVDRESPMLVLGGGSNVVINDEAPVSGLVVQMAITGRAFVEDGADVLVRAGAGENWDSLVADIVARDLAGVECLSGIPGTVGGTPIQNVGAYGQEVSGSIETVEAFDRHAGTMVTLSAGECGFSYRMSRFKSHDAARFIVCAVTLRVRPGAPAVRYPELAQHLAGIARPSVRDVREAVLVIRRRKGMVVDAADPDSRSVGSFFMNPVVSRARRDEVSRRAGLECPSFPMGADDVKIPAAWLIERSGFKKGFTDGAVAISSKHPLALVNRGGAAARDVLRLATSIKSRVLDRFDVAIQAEPVFVAFDGGDADVEFLKAAGT